MKTTLLAGIFAFAAFTLATPAPQEISTQGIDTAALKKGPQESSSWKGLDDPQAKSVSNAWRNIYGKGSKYKDTCNSILTDDFEAYSCSTQTTWGKRPTKNCQLCNSKEVFTNDILGSLPKLAEANILSFYYTKNVVIVYANIRFQKSRDFVAVIVIITTEWSSKRGVQISKIEYEYDTLDYVTTYDSKKKCSALPFSGKW